MMSAEQLAVLLLAAIYAENGDAADTLRDALNAYIVEKRQ